MRTNERFEALCRAEYTGLVRAAYLIVGDRDEATDLAQEALVRAFERWRTVSRLERPGAWCQRVVVNLALTNRRRSARRHLLHLSDEPVVDPDPTDPGLMRALASLGDQQRAVVVLRYLCDLSVAETAYLLDKPEGTVRSIASQATARLRERLVQANDRSVEEMTT